MRLALLDIAPRVDRVLDFDRTDIKIEVINSDDERRGIKSLLESDDSDESSGGDRNHKRKIKPDPGKASIGPSKVQKRESHDVKVRLFLLLRQDLTLTEPTLGRWTRNPTRSPTRRTTTLPLPPQQSKWNQKRLRRKIRWPGASVSGAKLRTAKPPLPRPRRPRSAKSTSATRPSQGARLSSLLPSQPKRWTSTRRRPC